MANFRLNLNGDFTSEILSLYLWGQKRAPSKDEIASNKWIGRKEESITAIVNGEQFVNKAGNFVNAKDFKLFDVFFSGKMRDGKKLNVNNIRSKVEINNKELILNHDQFVELFYRGTSEEGSAQDAYKSLSLYDRNIYGENFAKLAFMFGTITVGLDTENIRYVLDKDLNPIRVDNVSYIVKDEWKGKKENFDFDGGKGSDDINGILKQVADPSNIGKKVIIKFDGTPTVKAGTISKKVFKNLNNLSSLANQKHPNIGVCDGLQDEDKNSCEITLKMQPYFDKYRKFYEEYKRIRGTGVIDFRAEDDRLVIFGTKENDTLEGTKATNFNFTDNVNDGNNYIPDSLTAMFFDLNHYKQYIKNGIVYVGGNGADNILGTKYNDILYASDSSLYDDNSNNILNGDDGDDILYGSNGYDTLIGGNGFDTYYAGDKDEIIDSDGKGQVIFNGSTLKGGSYDEDRKVYIDAKDTSITYKLKDNNDLIVTKGDSSITIRNFKKSEDGFLNINLNNNPGKEVAIVIDTTGSMGDDIATCKANAKIIASNIFKENFYSKISIVTYNDNDIKTIGTYTNYQSFLGGINKVHLQNGGTEYTMAAILEGMSNFSPYNHLSKEVYVMTDEPGDDNHRRDEVERKAKNLSVGFRSIYNANKYEDNSVKINFIAIRNEFEHFKDLAKNTNGMYFNSNSSEELSDALFELSNIGTSSNDTIEGNDKDNSLNGFGGDDTLVGKAGSDTYTFTGLNFGNDTIIESNLNNIDKNTIIFKDVSYKDVRFKKDLNDLKITLNKDNSVTIKDFYNTNNESKISSISFSDVTLDELAIKRSVSMQANKEAIIFLKEKDFSFSNFATSTFAVAYQDNASNISTSYKDDVIIGSNKNDIISTKLGNDTLIGGKGDDKLYGGFGNDIYVYRKGDGNDLIYDDGGQDALKLQNLKADEIFLIKDGKDLLIKFKDDDTNSIRVAHHFAWKFGYHNQINTIELDDNKFINTKTIDKLIEQTSAFAKNNGIDIHNINHINDDRLNQIYMSAWN
ncbi:VWA domain-containing protein [Campylobacter sp. MG1]|uniref:VWA domain-containing protein n=1 Tax=Campylobacter sp. MG1 TaxID=2976332 RepID=UPI00226CC57F|nr:VWA domain-containing protein [Campylobacter sp. MG1]